jgi:hypothetical protein
MKPLVDALAQPDADLLEKWRMETENLKKQISVVDSPSLLDVKRVAGLDLSFVENDASSACACLIVLSFPDCEKVLHEEKRMVTLTQPYLPGFLGFRESDFLVNLLEDLRAAKPELFPQVVLVDGNGVFHQQGAVKEGIVCILTSAKNRLRFGLSRGGSSASSVDWCGKNIFASGRIGFWRDSRSIPGKVSNSKVVDTSARRFRNGLGSCSCNCRKFEKAIVRVDWSRNFSRDVFEDCVCGIQVQTARTNKTSRPTKQTVHSWAEKMKLQTNLFIHSTC